MGGKTAAEKGPDNNKRLAELEAGVSDLALALAANGVAVGAGEDPIALAIAAVKARAAALETNEQLVKTNAELTKLLEEATSAEGGNATAGEIAAIARAEAAEKRNLEAENELEQLRSDVADLEEKIAKLEEAGNVSIEPAPAPRERPSSARDFGPTFGSVDREQLEEAIGNGADFEIAFSNGEFEIVDLAPQPIASKQLRLVADKRRIVDVPVFVKGGEHREDIAGAALLLGGEQVAYCAFPSPVAIEKGQERRFDRQFIF